MTAAHAQVGYAVIDPLDDAHLSLRQWVDSASWSLLLCSLERDCPGTIIRMRYACARRRWRPQPSSPAASSLRCRCITTLISRYITTRQSLTMSAGTILVCSSGNLFKSSMVQMLERLWGTRAMIRALPRSAFDDTRGAAAIRTAACERDKEAGLWESYYLAQVLRQPHRVLAADPTSPAAGPAAT